MTFWVNIITSPRSVQFIMFLSFKQNQQNQSNRLDDELNRLKRNSIRIWKDYLFGIESKSRVQYMSAGLLGPVAEE